MILLRPESILKIHSEIAAALPPLEAIFFDRGSVIPHSRKLCTKTALVYSDIVDFLAKVFNICLTQLAVQPLNATEERKLCLENWVLEELDTLLTKLRISREAIISEFKEDFNRHSQQRQGGR